MTSSRQPQRDGARPSDPDPPYSIFDKRQKVLIVLIVSTAATFSGFSSNIYFPAIPSIARDFHVSVELVNLTVTSYLVFQGLAPSLWGPISDAKGRRAAYFGTFLVFVGACVGLAMTKDYASLVVLRCLQSTGSASTIAIGTGVIGDITTRAERGGYMGVFQAGLLAPVAIGPVIGETLRHIVGNGSHAPSGLVARCPLIYYRRMTKLPGKDRESMTAKARQNVDLTGPIRILISKQAFPIILFLSFYYSVWQMSIATMSSLFESHYGLGETEIGLTFIANGVGSIIGTLLTGTILNVDYCRVNQAHETKKSNHSVVDNVIDFPLEKARLRLVPLFALIQCASILVFGWSFNYPQRVHIAVPIASTFVTGWIAVSIQSVVMTCLVDVFPDRSAAASASLNLARCLLAAGGTSFIMPMINSIGVGLAFTVCVIAQVVALLGVAVQWRFAGAWRKEAAERRQHDWEGSRSSV